MEWVIEHLDYYRYRGQLIDFLEGGHAEKKVLTKEDSVSEADAVLVRV